uniref:Putative transposase tnp2 n=1 Tax=Malus domestica TaxID=3750 RepID=E4Z8N4_MALDO|nr:putative transposase tnp2 [Malus domestica]
MADSREGPGKKKLVVQIERYRRKQVLYFEDCASARISSILLNPSSVTCHFHFLSISSSNTPSIFFFLLIELSRCIWLQRLYMLTHTATDMRWHKEKRVNNDVMRHPADGEAWKEFDRMFPEFAADSRNVRLGLATERFNPFGDVETTFNRPPRNNDEGVRKEKLSVFAQIARPFGDPICGESFSKKDMEVNQLKASNSPAYTEELYNLAFKRIRVELYSGCHVNGVKFLAGARDDKLCTQNNDIHVPRGGESTDIEFYDDLKAGRGWKVVQKMDHRNVYVIPEQNRTDNDIDNVADQRRIFDGKCYFKFTREYCVTNTYISSHKVYLRDEIYLFVAQVSEISIKMSNLIKTRRAMTSTPSPTTTSTTAITAPAKMDHRPINLVDPVGPPVPQAQASSTSLVALPTNYNLEDMDEDMFTSSPNTTSSGRVTLHQCFQQFDDPQVTLDEGCPKELKDRQDSWKGSKFPEIDVFANIYVRPRNELTESFHLLSDTPIEYVDPPENAGFHIMTETLDQTFGRRPRTYCRGMENAKRREIPPEYISHVYLHHRPHSPSTLSKHSNQARRPLTPSPTSSKIL